MLWMCVARGGGITSAAAAVDEKNNFPITHSHTHTEKNMSWIDVQHVREISIHHEIVNLIIIMSFASKNIFSLLNKRKFCSFSHFSL